MIFLRDLIIFLAYRLQGCYICLKPGNRKSQKHSQNHNPGGLMLKSKNYIWRSISRYPAWMAKRSAPLLLVCLMATLAFAQTGSGDISGSTSNISTLGTTILKLVIVLAGLGFVGMIIWGALSLTTNRQRGLAMVGGGVFGAAIAGITFAIVNTLTGQTVTTGMLLAPFQKMFLS
jgi:hypothetical protein